MKDWVLPLCEGAAAAVSLVLMGIFGTRLLARFIRVLRGRETADGLGESRQSAPGGELAAAALTALLSRLVVYVLAYAMYRFCGGAEGLFASLEPLWSHWDTRHYVGIARDGYTAMGDERLRLVFFPLYPVLMRALSLAAGGSLFAGGVLISLVCTTLSAALLYDLCYMHGGRGTARLALAYFLLSPLSVFLNCAYTEALFICLTLAAVCLLVSRIEDFLRYWSDWDVHWKLAALIFVLAAILSLLVVRALKKIKEELELKVLMN